MYDSDRDDQMLSDDDEYDPAEEERQGLPDDTDPVQEEADWHAGDLDHDSPEYSDTRETALTPRAQRHLSPSVKLPTNQFE